MKSYQMVPTNLFLISLFLISFVDGDFLRHCVDQSVCQNHGRCFLSAARQSTDRCLNANSEFSETDQMCLTSYGNRLIAYDEAQKNCANTLDSQLIRLQSVEKRNWLQQKFFEELKAGVWIEESNDNFISSVFAAINNNSSEESKCLLAQVIDGSMEIVYQPCDHRHLAVCEKEADRFNGSDHWYVQCECPRGYAGRYCEFAKSEDKAFDRIKCADENLNVLCEENSGTLVVDYALYGRAKDLRENTCEEKEETNVDCIDSSSLMTLVNRCQGRKSCKINRIADLFPNTNCTGGMSLQHRMRCTRVPETVCPHATTFINERCYELSKSQHKLNYAEAKRHCAAKGGQLAHFDSNSNLFEFLESKPHRDYEVWVYNDTDVSLPLKRKAECLAIAWWNRNVVQIPCFASLGYICEFLPTGRTPERIRGTPRAQKTNSETEKPKCPEQQWNKLTIPETKACEIATVECPNHLDGTLTWLCDCKSATWSTKPDLSDCLNPSIRSLKELISIGEEPLSVMQMFQVKIDELFDSKSLTGGDVIAFIENFEESMFRVKNLLNNRSKSAEWRGIYGQKFSKVVGSVGDRLLDSEAEDAWLQLSDTLRIERAAKMMTLLQDILVVRGLGLTTGTKATVQFRNYEGQVLLKEPVPPANDVPMMINRAMRIQNIPMQLTHQNVSADQIQFKVGGSKSIMQLPNSDFLSSLAPQFSHATMLFSHSRGESLGPTENEGVPPVKLGYFTFTKLGKLMSNSTNKSRINSQIFGAFVNDPNISVNLAVGMAANFTFQHLITEGVSNASCVFWDIFEGTWSRNGCVLIETNKQTTKCSCSHLTSFAVLMDFTDSLAVYNGQFGQPKSAIGIALDVITIVGCTTSIVCLFLCVLVFTIFRSLHSNIRVVIHRNLCLSLLAGELLFLFGIDKTESTEVCRSVAIGLHYFFLCSFLWCFFEGYQLYLMLIKVFESSRKHTELLYCLGFVLPAIWVAISVFVEPNNYGTDDYCWINVQSPTIWAFLLPIGLVIFFNITTLAIAFRTVLSVQNRDRSLALRVYGWLKGSLTLCCLLGVTWVFGFLTAIQVVQPFFAFVFTILNSLQGAFIFGLHVVCNEKARQAILRCVHNGVCGSQVSETSKQSSSSYNQRSNNFFALNKDRLLQWWPLSKSRSSNSSGSSQKSSRELEIRFKPIALIHQLATPEEEERAQTRSDEKPQEEDEQITRKRLLAASPEVTVERF
ncbi:CBN-LAT-2 protein [Aphelenchoides besseyi]|nr:CBN-LAT-2 protein [Aphelenchoides besseyi]